MALVVPTKALQSRLLKQQQKCQLKQTQKQQRRLFQKMGMYGIILITYGDMSIAREFGCKDGYVYVIQTNNYVDINATYGAAEVFNTERRIKPSGIVGAYKKQGGKIIGDFIPDSDFGGN